MASHPSRMERLRASRRCLCFASHRNFPLTLPHVTQVFIMEGNALIGPSSNSLTPIKTFHTSVLSGIDGESGVQIESATDKVRLVVAAGEPLQQKIFQHGPFVMVRRSTAVVSGSRLTACVQLRRILKRASCRRSRSALALVAPAQHRLIVFFTLKDYRDGKNGFEGAAEWRSIQGARVRRRRDAVFFHSNVVLTRRSLSSAVAKSFLLLVCSSPAVPVQFRTISRNQMRFRCASRRDPVVVPYNTPPFIIYLINSTFFTNPLPNFSTCFNKLNLSNTTLAFPSFSSRTLIGNPRPTLNGRGASTEGFQIPPMTGEPSGE